ncbi:MAG: methyltransferase domain-containing protein [Polyangiaceae bacterium]|nr:methyltransferase domain-containing protein [Polyangiaceae bacterium]
MNKKTQGAREAAAQVLRRVWHDQAFAAAALSVVLSDESRVMDARDRGLTTELVYGVLRTQGFLRRALEKHAQHIPDADDIYPHLLLAVYQLYFLDRIPARAAVNEAVDAVGRSRTPGKKSFANAVLRKVARDAEEPVTLSEAILASSPSWLRKRMMKAIGDESMRDLMASGRAFEPTLRFVEAEALPPWLETNCSSIPGVPSAYRYHAGGDPRRHPEYSSGQFILQELGAQLVAHALGAGPGESVFDVCAGRGQKTSLLARQVGASGQVVATDLYEQKVKSLTDELARLGLSAQAKVHDWTDSALVEWEGRFDRVLVDAPCTGVGTLRRRPEILRRLESTDPGRMGTLQQEILRNAASLVRPGGILVFATCSVLQEEGEEVVEQFLATQAGRFHLADADGELIPPLSKKPPVFRLLPHVDGSDGYFVARFQRSVDELAS